MSRIIGIDLGTTNSCVSYLNAGVPTIINTKEGNRSMPSVVAFSNGSKLVGELAKRQIEINSDTVVSIKSKMGTMYKVSLGGKSYVPQQISAMILHELKMQAEEYLGEKVSRAVITVPAYFNNSQRKATTEAAQIAGLQVERIINEPTAAALAYGLGGSKEPQKVLVYDLGGGTFDVSILDIEDDVFEVLSTRGFNSLGGDNFDEEIIKYIVGRVKDLDGVELNTEDKQTYFRLKEAAERAKKDLSSASVTMIQLPFISVKDGVPYHAQVELTRSKFESMIKVMLDETIGCMIRCLADSGLTNADLDKVILVGGSTRIPLVAEMVRKQTGLEPHKGINPDEVVALGAAVQAGIFEGLIEDLVLIDVAPLSLGVGTAGGIYTPLIKRNTPLPTEHKKVFTTAINKQERINLEVYQGERTLAKDNFYVGNLVFDGITPMPRGIPKLEVTFHIDHNGILAVTVEELIGKDSKSKSAILHTEAGLSSIQIANMIEESELMHEQDLIDAERVRLLNSIEDSLNQLRDVEKSIPSMFSESEKSLLTEYQATMLSVADHSIENNEKLKTAEKTIKDLKDSILIRVRSR